MEKEVGQDGSGMKQLTENLNFHSGIFRASLKFTDGRYGMSYTSFEYSKLQLDNTTIGKDETITATIEIKNVGQIYGSEVVQFYISDTQSFIKRPLKELK